ncbi:segregation and condensation protein A [Lacticaseibacillus camelliae]|uniref:segregation and condensation protein A n=1 Tax=Lacticaseibacillus camelliae TaxID=381742 RepID=UPI0006D137F1|nr:segregation/condensation protein A [Lacticaseibacillus camelliae]
MALTLVLNDFSGPLDLLWHLIRTNEVDIYDIPIAEITSQYLAYLHDMQTARLDVAGDYFVMAASLMAMKSKMLLPQPEPDQEADEDDYEDPRAGLVAQLLTYQVYQEAAEQLRDREKARSQSYAKPESLPGADVRVPMRPGSVKLNDISRAMAAVVARQLATKTTIAHIEAEPISVEKRISEVLRQIDEVGTCRFDALVAVNTVDGVVTTFLAILTLMKADQIICEQAGPFAPITVMKKEAA